MILIKSNRHGPQNMSSTNLLSDVSNDDEHSVVDELYKYDLESSLSPAESEKV